MWLWVWSDLVGARALVLLEGAVGWCSGVWQSTGLPLDPALAAGNSLSTVSRHICCPLLCRSQPGEGLIQKNVLWGQIRYVICGGI